MISTIGEPELVVGSGKPLHYEPPEDGSPTHYAKPGEFERYDLAALFAKGITPATLICGDMLYESCVHSLTGEPGCGKTTLAYWWALQALRDGRPVVVFDEESGPEQTVEKLYDLGGEATDLDQLHYFPFPGRGWNGVDLIALHETIMAIGPALIIWDSMAQFLARAGKDENAASDVTTFMTNVLVPGARLAHAAVVVLDHDRKDNGDAPSRYGRGSGAKLATADVGFKLTAVKPFSREHDGILRLTTNPGKDRRGYLAGSYRIRVGHGPPMTLTVSEGSDGEDPATADMPPSSRKLLEALNETPATVSELVDRVAAKHGHGLKRQTVSTALNGLLGDGLADRVDQGNGKAALWFKTCRSEGV